MCLFCPTPAAALAAAPAATHGLGSARRAFLLSAAGLASAPALAQVEVGSASVMRQLVPAETLEEAATQEYSQLIRQARAKNALAPAKHPQLQRLRAIAQRLVPFTEPWNPRVRDWQWEINLIGNAQINAFCMPGGKIVFYTGILNKLQLSDDEVAMVMGHEMAHALREHARERLVKTQATSLGLRLGAQLLGLGDLGGLAAGVGSELLTLKFSRSDESDADLVGLELAARAGYHPEAAVTLWRKMGEASGDKNELAFLSTHPSGPQRIRELERNVPKVQGLYEAARGGG